MARHDECSKEVERAIEVFRQVKRKLLDLCSDPATTSHVAVQVFHSLTASAAKAYKVLADAGIARFDKRLCCPALTGDQAKDAELWCLTWKCIATCVSTTIPGRRSATIPFGTPVIRNIAGGTYVLTVPLERWKEFLRDNGAVLELLAQWAGDGRQQEALLDGTDLPIPE
jgi:hypothetical protein